MIVVTLTLALAWVSHFQVLPENIFYVMGKVLSGELSCMLKALVTRGNNFDSLVNVALLKWGLSVKKTIRSYGNKLFSFRVEYTCRRGCYLEHKLF